MKKFTVKAHNEQTEEITELTTGIPKKILDSVWGALDLLEADNDNLKIFDMVISPELDTIGFPVLDTKTGEKYKVDIKLV